MAIRTLLPALLILTSFVSTAQSVRPIRDDIGFCWTADGMERLMTALEREGTLSVPDLPYVAAISPHDDYLYAGRLYYPLFRSIHPKEVVIFGVTHGAVRKEIGDPRDIVILESYDSWRGAFGPIQPSPLRQYITQHLDRRFMSVDNKAHELEHSIEALLPFLQISNPAVRITPIMVTAMEFGRMDTLSEALSSLIAEYMRANGLKPGTDIFFLMSCDANHYGKDFNNTPFGEDAAAHAKATAEDRRIARTYVGTSVTPATVAGLAGELKKVVWCGRYSVPFGMATAEKVIRKTLGRGLRGEVIRYSDSFTEGVLPLKGTEMGLTAPFSLKHWVGYLSAGFVVE